MERLSLFVLLKNIKHILYSRRYTLRGAKGFFSSDFKEMNFLNSSMANLFANSKFENFQKFPRMELLTYLLDRDLSG